MSDQAEVGYADDDEGADPIVFLNTGRIRITLDTPGGPQVVTLGRPSLGLYRYLRERLVELSEDARARRRALAEAKVIATDGVSDEDRAKLVDEAEAGLTGTEYDPTVETAEWVVLVLERLGGATVAPDDLPVWATSPLLPAKLIGHWRSVPLARGSQHRPPGTPRQ